MTMPCERTRAVQRAREFMQDLLDPKVTPKVPGEIREMARRVLRHYPFSYDLEQAAKGAASNWGAPEKEERKRYEDYAAHRAERAAVYDSLRDYRKKRTRKSRR